MNLVNCYRLLGLTSEAELAEIKASYRRLARRYHPDANPDNQEAHAHFIRLTEAYKMLLSTVSANEPQPQDRLSQPETTAPSSPVKTQVKYQPPPPVSVPFLSAYEYELKWQSYDDLQQLLKENRLARAVLLVEGLSQRLPRDAEIRQWQAITYQFWARQLISERKLDKARIYLKKALQVDPHNRSLWAEIERDFQRMETLY